MNINFKVADVITPLVAVGELQRRGITVVMGPHRIFVTRSQVTKSLGRNPNFEHCNGAYWMSLTRWKNGTKAVALVNLGDAVPPSKSLNELPSVKYTIDVVREDTEANVSYCGNNFEGARSRREIRARADARGVQESGLQLRPRSRNGRLSPQVRQLQRIAKGGVCLHALVESRATRESWVDHLRHD